MIEMLLDQEGDVPPGPEYALVTSEVAFLDKAGDGREPLHVRGPILCQWAKELCDARKVPYRFVLSPTRELQLAFAEVDKASAFAIYGKLQGAFDKLPRPLTADKILTVQYPARFWSEPPSNQHAAEWLLWLVEYTFDLAFKPLIDACCETWQTQVKVSEKVLYAVRSRERALQVLDEWLCIADSSRPLSLGEFPLPVPSFVIQRATEAWRQQAVATSGEFCARIVEKNIPLSLKQVAVRETANYYRKQPHALTEASFAVLKPYLTLTEQSDLRRLLPPKPPTKMPLTPIEVLQWFKHEYLPFRQWQAIHKVEAVAADVQGAAREFAVWYLKQYSAALTGGKMSEHLSFKRSAALAGFQPTAAVLLIVLDGLHVADAEYLKFSLANRTNRLTQIEDGLAYAPVPTITQFCKPALFRGVAPNLTDEVEEIGIVLPERRSPIAQLKSAKLGDLFLWRVQEPDNTYHKRNSYDTLRRLVEGQLDTIAANIYDIVQEVPDHIRLRIIVTTDHGRLLADSERTQAAPVGMQVHGRTAWGTCAEDLSEGFYVEDNLAYLNHASFGLPADTAILLDESAFVMSDGRTGSEQFPHGGLFPEEVIIPWLEYERDFVAPVLAIHLSGQGQAGKPGELLVSAVNTGEIDVILQTLILTAEGSSQAVHLNYPVEPSSVRNQQVMLSIWPSQSQLKSMRAKVQTRLNNGMIFEIDAKLELKSEEMYQREDILEGLDL